MANFYVKLGQMSISHKNAKIYFEKFSKIIFTEN